jgi:hypothetical protein
MLLSAVFFAAALQAAPLVVIPDAPPVQLPPPPVAKMTPGARQLAAWQARRDRIAKCNRFGLQRARGAPSEGAEKAKKLGEMPAAHGERAVLRMVDGCAVSTPIVQRVPAP